MRTHRVPCLLFVLTLATGCGAVPKLSASADKAADNALSMVGKPYHYGGNTPAVGFDCSGLVQWSYGSAGTRLPHGTDYLRRHSRPISLRYAQRGDLLFFYSSWKSHVAIYIGDDRFVHAPSTGKTVYVANLADPYWKKNFDQARRLDVD